MKNLAFVVALLILGVGAVGLIMPSGLVWVAQHSVTSGVVRLAGVLVLALGGFLAYACAPARRAA